MKYVNKLAQEQSFLNNFKYFTHPKAHSQRAQMWVVALDDLFKRVNPR